MAACYYDHGMTERAVFSLHIRDYPPRRRYFVAAGLEDALRYLHELRFTPGDLEYLDSLQLFKKEFLDYLGEFRFSGDVWAIPEGRLVFVHEPLLEVEAPLIEAQLVETYLINVINLQTMIATKASRCYHASGGRPLVDFSLRRDQGTEAGLKVARASAIGGFVGTSNVLAGKTYGLPVFGTMAHSFVSSFDREIEAFRAFARTFPRNAVLLLDTYDTVSGALKAARVGREMAERGEKIKGVRLDSGEIAGLSRAVRRVLVQSGLGEATIFASGGIDEDGIRRIIRRGGDVDAFGVGTKLGVSADAPFLDIAYKMVECGRRPVVKLSPGKATWAGRKQVFRFPTPAGKMKKDVIGLRDDRLPGEPLLQEVMRRGKLTSRMPSLAEIRKRFLDEFGKLDEKYKAIEGQGPFYPVSFSRRLRLLQAKAVRSIKLRELGRD